MQNANIFLNVGAKWVRVVALLACLFACPLVQECQAFEASRPARMPARVLWSCAPPFGRLVALRLVRFP